MRRIWRLGVVALAALVAFTVAVDRFGYAAERGCAQRAPRDPSYRVVVEDPPRVDVNRYRLMVTRQGVPVTEARVCLNAAMQGMSAMAVADQASEVAPGAYEVTVSFAMGGKWAGRVLITEAGESVVAVPLTIEVMAGNLTP